MGVRMPAMLSSHTRAGLALGQVSDHLLRLASDVRAALLYAKEEADALWKVHRDLRGRVERLEAWQDECSKSVEDAADRGEAP